MEPILAPLLIGGAVGFLGGLLGKGGSAIATPMLVAAGVPPLLAVAAPLPATIPGTLVAADRYRRRDLFDRGAVRWSIVAGVPAVVLGALLTRWIAGDVLVVSTDVLILAIGVHLVVNRSPRSPTAARTARLPAALVAIGTGLAAGLLANSGGFLLAPLYLAVLRLPVKTALGTSLVVSAALAVPGTLVHLALGHIDWSLVAVFAAGSVPLSSVGAALAIRIDAQRLERAYGAVLVVLGTGFLILAR